MGPAVSARLTAIRSIAPEILVAAELSVDTKGEGFTEITADVRRFVAECGAGDGVLLLYLRHTDPDVQTDLMTALHLAAPADGPWVHKVEGPDDMPAHIKTMLTGVTLHVPVREGTLALGTWQGIYLAEHRTRPHRRDVVLQYIGSRA